MQSHLCKNRFPSPLLEPPYNPYPPVHNGEYVRPCEFLRDLLEECLLPAHRCRLPVHDPDEEVGVEAEAVDPDVEVGVDVDAGRVHEDDVVGKQGAAVAGPEELHAGIGAETAAAQRVDDVVDRTERGTYVKCY